MALKWRQWIGFIKNPLETKEETRNKLITQANLVENGDGVFVFGINPHRKYIGVGLSDLLKSEAESNQLIDVFDGEAIDEELQELRNMIESSSGSPMNKTHLKIKVGPNEDYTELADAINFFIKYKNIIDINAGYVKCEIEIQSDYVFNTPLWLQHMDMSHIIISSVSGIVEINKDIDTTYSLMEFYYCKLPQFKNLEFRVSGIDTPLTCNMIEGYNCQLQDGYGRVLKIADSLNGVKFRNTRFQNSESYIKGKNIELEGCSGVVKLQSSQKLTIKESSLEGTFIGGEYEFYRSNITSSQTFSVGTSYYVDSIEKTKSILIDGGTIITSGDLTIGSSESNAVRLLNGGRIIVKDINGVNNIAKTYSEGEVSYKKFMNRGQINASKYVKRYVGRRDINNDSSKPTVYTSVQEFTNEMLDKTLEELKITKNTEFNYSFSFKDKNTEKVIEVNDDTTLQEFMNLLESELGNKFEYINDKLVFTDNSTKTGLFYGILETELNIDFDYLTGA
jgi:hypothetical protein